MRSQFLIVPAVVAASVTPAAALDIQTLEAAQARLLGSASATPADFTLTPPEVDRLKSEFEVPLLRPAVKAWRTKTGEWVFLDQVYGLNDIITYMALIDKAGTVRGIEILVCVEGFCDISTPEWQAQFHGKTAGKWVPGKDTSVVSGATLSTTHVAEGIKKLLAIHAHFLPK